MKNSFIILLALLLCSCAEDSDDNSTASYFAFVGLEFTHNWDGAPINNSDFNQFKYTNNNGESMSISKLRYVISDVTLYDEDNNIKNIYTYPNLVDVSDANSLSFGVFDSIPIGNYGNISFRFGLKDSQNVSGFYTNLDSEDLNIPNNFGGGYYYMQLEGQYFVPTANDSIDAVEIDYQFYTNRAVDTTHIQPSRDTSIKIDLGPTTITDNKILTIKMNVAEWFKNPNTWDLDVLHSDLTPNYNAQIMMNENGQNVFSLDN
ncbi:conserved hypothetical protein [Formosa agariphila KMM 3901]|uniref:Copper-binding protein MbnP-like domain-containing protein n=1 Tax=Formosa agariphila (strain DSM 15362 / KCTC 12365 / LMG 23005 / KMM 3901 / M-2Alg 35-1) TaxID=1347342 RepID=T2KQH9_FORAG|nr:MbnP family protein [Formosa agariphila]CDF80990.1 conserved hypothetical protein [Formosa agariphila KMM 3901]